MKIKRNALQCRYCMLILESTHVHDFRTHICKLGPQKPELRWDMNAKPRPVLVETGKMEGPYMMVDGGHAYLRQSYNPEHHIDLSEYEDGEV